MAKIFISIENGKKVVGESAKFKNLNLHISKNEIYGIVCSSAYEADNLIKILSGKAELDEAYIRIENKRLLPGEAAERLRRISGVMDSENRIVSQLSLSSNVFLVREKMGTFIAKDAKLDASLDLLFKKFDVPISPRKKAGTLTNLERCIVELLRLYSRGIELIIIDQRINVFTTKENKLFYEFLKKLKEYASVIVFENDPYLLSKYADDFLLVENFRTLYEMENLDDDILKLAKAVSFKKPDIPNVDLKKGEERVFTFENINTEYITDFNADVVAGEIYTIRCENENAFADLLDIIKGYGVPLSGKMNLCGEPYAPKGIQYAVRMGVTFIEPNKEVSENLFPNMSVYDNYCIGRHRKTPFLWLKPRYKKVLEKEINTGIGRNVTTESINSMSVLEHQKLVFMKWRLVNPKVIFCINPFTTLDAYMNGNMKEYISNYSAKGIAVIIISQNKYNLYYPSSRVVSVNARRMRDD